MMKRVLLISFLCGVSAFFGTLGFLYGTQPQPEPVVNYSDVTDLTWQAYIPKPEQVESPAALLIVDTDDILEYEPLDAFCLAKNIYHEARSEDLLGQMAVAQVTLNRVESSRYPGTICKVVMQPWQFSWANRHSNRWSHPKGKDWHAAKSLANQFLENGVRVQGLETALFYHADYVQPKWMDPDSQIAQVGTHIFYEKAKNL